MISSWNLSVVESLGASRAKCPLFKVGAPDLAHFHQEVWGPAGILCQRNVP